MPLFFFIFRETQEKKGLRTIVDLDFGIHSRNRPSKWGFQESDMCGASNWDMIPVMWPACGVNMASILKGQRLKNSMIGQGFFDWGSSRTTDFVLEEPV